MLAKRVVFILISLVITACSDSNEGVALGTLERERVIHPATTNEILIDLPVSAGQLVEKGQVIAKFDAELQQAIVAKAQAQLAQATAFLEKTLNGARPEEVAAASAKVAAANAAYTQSEANFRRAKTLVKDKLASQETLDSATAARDETFANLESAKQNLNELTNGSRVEDINSAKAQVQAAEAELKVQQKYLSDLTIKAMRAGRVDNLPWHVGERVTKGSPVVIIQANSAPYARVYIPEPYRAKLNQGMTLTVRVDGIDKDIQGELTWIASEPAFTPFYALNQEERARLMYLAEVTLPVSENNLPTGVPAQVIMP
ncbi:HlyD family efflux transporter periplasmic adaptor subunit [Pseudoalteromonas shioyasakiensis]|jgi:HlyD family secretion protein|uniref:HlyD family efflux transporter periplasmic adaptor subunit n=1 Tax=Pseudoalteromonas shioyasakiensis TaxID=1190813 RepID=A0ABT6U163_9GAMM|nr:MULTISPECIES: HlyD family efflux transporter periplasmic adaptor subunit [Pseudoalteromonas]MDI4669856.1 HlyD family efflux transporter periplasmic adaptor subunit [Pseudoalteromonas shioyasakiensis]MDI4671915.1 HlyD family efflux transporter periplasmic adaptor subunit [Pseudoalteromonas shioyasakiensis]MDI4686771.1 HlyD family efflux transporter periplasmic adaptor subunit [Pseudoalteromonas shioyasakiensis]MDI4705366.1 HlyD family efflux transporter periplasmic adaptor subunit [Pseudoalte